MVGDFQFGNQEVIHLLPCEINHVTRVTFLPGVTMFQEHRIRRSTIVLAAMALITSGAIATTSGTAVADPPAGEEALRADIQIVAQQRGISYDDAFKAVDWQDGVAGVMTKLAEKFPDFYSGAEVTSETPAAVKVRFKGSAPAEAISILAGIDAAIKVDIVEDQPLNETDIHDVVRKAHESLTSLLDADTAVSSSYDRNGNVVKSVANSAGFRLRESDLESRVSAGIATSAPGVQYDLTLSESFNASPTARNGGGRLEHPSSEGLACTGGFNVISSAGTTGVATAGHCANGLTHENRPGQAEFTMTYRAQHMGTYGDYQWHTTTDTEPDDFYFSKVETSARDVRGVFSPMDNQTICKFGWVTGSTCDTVADLSDCITYPGYPQMCRLVRTDHRKAIEGDSGGPWFYSYNAYGLTSGWLTCNIITGDQCDLFSRATYIYNALGVSVRTG
ncbi:S1 family peptidase [Microlunatus speluncae]|uniref:S1 family peptidase n=1 Tax=Microlunatus speluncae TaxID=2594267 RepID=UPI0012661D86|nr:S1 family peptidase [Microlunatus speluncae]